MSEDELEISSHSFAKTLRTRVGPGPEKNNQTQNEASAEDAGAGEGADYNVAPNVREAFDFAQMWQIPAESTHASSPREAATSAEDLDKALKAVTASQKQEFPCKGREYQA